MSRGDEPFGARLHAELLKLCGYGILTDLLTYKAIRQLKRADRATTVAIFAPSSDEVLQQFRSMKPEHVARYLVDNALRPAHGGSVVIRTAALSSD